MISRRPGIENFNSGNHDGGATPVPIPNTTLGPLVPMAYCLSLLGKRPRLGVFGDDFATPDGTAVRDYVHVTDLASAHILALRALLAGGSSDIVNLGTESGHSVLDVIKASEKATGRAVPYDIGPRRQGDVAVLLASKEKAEKSLGWKPRLSSLETIIETAWNWHRQAH